jgi:hypothetical protein
MAKKKKKKKNSISILKEVDKTLDGTYDDLMKEIEEMQLRLNYADQKARKKAKKLSKKKGGQYCDYETLRKEVRMEVVGHMESNNFLERVMKVLNDIAPIIVVIGRLIASLILAILSMDVVKLNIKPETLASMDKVYKKAMAVR